MHTSTIQVRCNSPGLVFSGLVVRRGQTRAVGASECSAPLLPLPPSRASRDASFDHVTEHPGYKKTLVKKGS